MPQETIDLLRRHLPTFVWLAACLVPVALVLAGWAYRTHRRSHFAAGGVRSLREDVDKLTGDVNELKENDVRAEVRITELQKSVEDCKAVTRRSAQDTQSLIIGLFSALSNALHVQSAMQGVVTQHLPSADSDRHNGNG